ncbi:MAG TPA: hypothetical protein VGC41_11455 [Kofleriaceae bacterium]
MSIAKLEIQVRTAWDREAIEIYADHLQAIGDPRGELVSIDLAIDEAVRAAGFEAWPADPDLSSAVSAAVLARRDELIDEWFGVDVPAGTVRYGFVDVDASGMGPGSQLAAALRGPGGRFIRSVTLAGSHDELAPAVRAIASEQRPWLTSLTIRQWNEPPSQPLLGRGATRALFDAMPHLRSLTLEGRRILDAVAHPHVEQLRITGFDAIPIDAVWTKLRSLDFAFHCQYAREHIDPAISVIATLIPPSKLPTLAHLDFSRNEPGHTEPRSLGGEVFMSAFFARFSRHATLASVRLPALKNRAAIDSVEATLASLPSLREATIYAPNERLPKHPTATITEIPIKTETGGPLRLA